MDQNGLMKKGVGKGFVASNSGRGETRPATLNDPGETVSPDPAVLSPLFIELAHRMKNTLSSIRNLTLLSRGKFRDLEFEEYFQRSTTEDILKIESVINGLLNYVRVSTPMIKSNTVHFLIEEVVERLRDQIEEKKIRLVKKFEKGIPETVVHEEQMRYVFHSLLQYAIAAIPAHGSLGILTRQAEFQKTSPDKRGASQKDGRFVEVLIGMNGGRKNITAFQAGTHSTSFPKDETMELVLRLVREIINKNRGTLRFEVDEKKGRTFISVLFPVERRKIVYYPKSSS